MLFKVMSREQAKNWCLFPQKEISAVISISDAWATPNRIIKTKMNKIRDVLFLHFDDIDAERDGLFYGMTENDAEKIADFVFRNKEQVSQFVVHCNAGISRSAGVCAAISKFLTGDDEQFFSSHYHPNMHCYRKVLEALHNKECSIMEEK